jgi:ParB family chromosome partitioning protein
MPAETVNTRPRLKNLDDLFLLNDGKNPLDEAPADTPQHPSSIRRLQANMPIVELVPFEGHPFRLYEGERLDDMVESIRENGVLVPIIVRTKGDKQEILSGHNRVNAAKLAGLTHVPAILLGNISDEEALIYVIETNLLQRSFADMAHSEKAAVIALQHSKLFSQGKRNDILNELKMLEFPLNDSENETFHQVGEKLRSDVRVAEMYSLSKINVSRYLRINQLINELKIRLDNGGIAFIPAVTLSFLKESEQQELARCAEINKFSIDMKKADTLRAFSEKGKLDDERIYLILNGEIGKKPKPNRTPTVKARKDVYAKYFKPNQPAREVEEIIEKALELYFQQGI